MRQSDVDEVRIPTPDEDRAAIRSRFQEVFGTTDHHLLTSMIEEYGRSRTRASIMSDLDTAEKAKSGNTKSEALGWQNESISL